MGLIINRPWRQLQPFRGRIPIYSTSDLHQKFIPKLGRILTKNFLCSVFLCAFECETLFLFWDPLIQNKKRSMVKTVSLHFLYWGTMHKEKLSTFYHSRKCPSTKVCIGISFSSCTWTLIIKKFWAWSGHGKQTKKRELEFHFWIVDSFLDDSKVLIICWETDKQKAETFLDKKFWKRRDIFNERIKVLLSWSHPFFDPNLKVLPVIRRGGRPTLYISVSTPNFFPLPFHFLIILLKIFIFFFLHILSLST